MLAQQKIRRCNKTKKCNVNYCLTKNQNNEKNYIFNFSSNYFCCYFSKCTSYKFWKTASYIPVFTTSTNIGNSAMYQNGSSIGIGTTSPSLLFDIAGTGGGSGSTAFMRTGSYSSTYSDWHGMGGIVVMKSHNTIGTLSTTQSGESLGQITFAGVNSNNNSYTQAAIVGVQTGTAGSSSWGPAQLQFQVGSTGGNIIALAIGNSTGTNGNVGLETSPHSLLEVNGTIGEQAAGTDYGYGAQFYLQGSGAQVGLRRLLVQRLPLILVSTPLV